MHLRLLCRQHLSNFTVLSIVGWRASFRSFQLWKKERLRDLAFILAFSESFYFATIAEKEALSLMWVSCDLTDYLKVQSFFETYTISFYWESRAIVYSVDRIWYLKIYHIHIRAWVALNPSSARLTWNTEQCDNRYRYICEIWLNMGIRYMTHPWMRNYQPYKIPRGLKINNSLASNTK